MRIITLSYPLFFAVYPILFLFTFNQNELSIRHVLGPLALSVTAFSLTYFAFAKALKSQAKAGVIVALAAILFFSYGHVRNLLPQDFNIDVGNLKIGLDKTLLSVWIALLFLGVRQVIKFDVHKKLAKPLSIIAAILVVYQLGAILIYQIQSRKLLETDNEVSIVELDTSTKKDIYYLVFDRYASSGTLKRELDFDNKEFEDFLTDRGFYVANNSYANYPKTFQSLASSLNMTHLTHMTKEYGGDSSDQTPFNKMIRDNIVAAALKENGYKFIHIGSWWEPTRVNTNADINIYYNYFGLDEFSNQLLKTTFLFPLITRYQALDFGDENSLRVEQKIRIPYKFEKLSEVTKLEDPKFVFAHFLLPHGPYVFNADGSTVPEKVAKKRGDKENYLNHVKYANTMIMQTVDDILRNSDTAPIIVIQSDEGPCGIVLELAEKDGWGHCGEDIDWRNLFDNTLRVKMRILNAYYLPEADYDSLLYEEITPVNSFRVIFNQYFATNYDKLPDTSYMVQDLDHPYKFINITDKVRY
jgi:hypothetical protein